MEAVEAVEPVEPEIGVREPVEVVEPVEQEIGVREPGPRPPCHRRRVAAGPDRVQRWSTAPGAQGWWWGQWWSAVR